MPMLKNKSFLFFVKALFIVCCFLPLPGSAQEADPPGVISRSVRKDLAKQKKANKKMAARTHFLYFIIRTENQMYGYDIYADGNLYIHQPTLPGVGGLNGFQDTLSAGKTARLAIKKIKKGEIPPTISEKELKKLGAIQ
jgi:hypothetical protein